MRTPALRSIEQISNRPNHLACGIVLRRAFCLAGGGISVLAFERGCLAISELGFQISPDLLDKVRPNLAQSVPDLLAAARSRYKRAQQLGNEIQKVAAAKQMARNPGRGGSVAISLSIADQEALGAVDRPALE